MTAPLFFEDRKDGRTAAMLGAVEVGAIYPICEAHYRAAYECALPPKHGPVYVRNALMARLRLRRHVQDWLKVAHLRDGAE